MKKVFKIIGGLILGIIGIFLITRNKSNNKEEIAKIDDAIAEKEEKIEEVQQEAVVIEKARKKRKKNINRSKNKAIALETQKQNIEVETPVSAQDAKANILNKTNRGRKPNKA
jgi:septal ring factor EnvC (AmiA/AmiB activator)